MRWALVIALAACAGEESVEKLSDTSAGPPADDPRYDPSTWPDTIGGRRPATVRAPTDWDGVSPLPALFVVHSYGATGTLQDAYFGATGRPEPMVIILPDGTPDSSGARFWNAADACCDFQNDGVDDVAYFRRLINQVEEAFPVDRILFLGHSNGGFMSHRMGCELGDRITAIASLAGSNEERPCADSRPDVLQIHGTLDETILYETNSWTLGAEDSMRLWADAAGCDGTTSAGTADYVLEVDGAETVKTAWTGCSDGFDGELWTLEGGGHIPGFNESFRDDLYGWLLSR